MQKFLKPTTVAKYDKLRPTLKIFALSGKMRFEIDILFWARDALWSVL